MSQRLALHVVGACLLGMMLAGCGPSSKKAENQSATNAAPVPSRVVSRTNPVPPLRPGVRTNLASATARAAVKTNAVAAAPRTGAGTNAVSTGRLVGAKADAGIAGQFRRLQASPYFYPGVIVAALCVGLGAVFLFQFFQSKSNKTAEIVPADGVPKAAARPSVKKARIAPIHSCNVLQFGAEARHLWQFGSRGRGFVLNRQQTSFGGEPLPANIIVKDWRNLFQRKLNIAWLPPDQVFLRVAQFPVSEFSDTLAMVELQLEKLSPMPVAQTAWSILVLPHAEGNLQTVIVMIASRNGVEEFLGKLEGQGYLADRLELPRLDQLQATAITRDGAWIYPDALGGSNGALVAWWYGGVLQNLALITLPPANRAASLKEQLLQMAWGGELDGWLSSPPAWCLVADAPTAAEWEPPLREGLEQPIEVIAPLASPALAALTATRVAQTEPQANLLPAEFSTRYQQQFVDRLWMRGLGAVIGLYLIGVLIYFGWLQYALLGTTTVEQEVANLGPTYTNALQLKARLQILQDRQGLKYAALDCWKAVAELLPDGVTLEGYSFNDGKRVSLNGTAPADQVKRLLDFDADIRKAKKDGQALFDANAGDHVTYHKGASDSVSWSCVLELKRAETL